LSALPRKPTVQDRARLLDHDVGVDVVLIEDVGGVAHHDAGHDGQRVSAHGGGGGHVARHAAGATGLAGVEAHHRRRRRGLEADSFAVIDGRGRVRVGIHGLGLEGVGCRCLGRWARRRGARNGAGPNLQRFLRNVVQALTNQRFSSDPRGYKDHPL
jgi:hypothetical protein